MKKKVGNILFYSVCILLLLILLGQFGVLPVRFVIVRTGSMAPTFYPGDVAVIYTNPASPVRVNDIVLFHSGGDSIIHRVASVDAGEITTKGDANDSPDRSSIVKVDGKYLFSVPKLGFAFAAFQSGFNNIFGKR